MRHSLASRAITALALAAIAVWTGGLLALGAVVAPIIFNAVPSPTSADAMTLVFRRFDRVAVVCAVLLLLCEVGLAVTRKPLLRIDMARGAAAVIAGALILAQAMVVSPKIEALHRGGAIRGLGVDGMELESVHKLAEAGGKTQVVIALILIALHVWSLGERSQGEQT